MMKILIRHRKMIKNKKDINLYSIFTRNKRGLTLVEIMVSVVLVAIVMVSGTYFFSSSWRLSVESDEHEEIFRDIVSNLENFKARGDYATAIKDSDYLVKNKTFREKYVVTYSLSREPEQHSNSWIVRSKAEWNYGNDPESMCVDTIVAPKWETL